MSRSIRHYTLWSEDLPVQGHSRLLLAGTFMRSQAGRRGVSRGYRNPTAHHWSSLDQITVIHRCEVRIDRELGQEHMMIGIEDVNDAKSGPQRYNKLYLMRKDPGIRPTRLLTSWRNSRKGSILERYKKRLFASVDGSSSTTDVGAVKKVNIAAFLAATLQSYYTAGLLGD